jgi:hypothetical protein
LAGSPFELLQAVADEQAAHDETKAAIPSLIPPA